MPRNLGKFALAAIVAAVAYFALAYLTNSYAYPLAPGLEWSRNSFGTVAGSYAWLQVVHTLAIAIASVPVAILIYMTCRPQAIAVATIAGVLAALAGLAPMLMDSTTRSVLSGTVWIFAFSDHLKMALMLPLRKRPVWAV